MICLPESVKNQYKDYDRQMQVFANLYLAETRQSKNMLNASFGEINSDVSSGIHWRRENNKYYYSSTVNFNGGVHWFIPVTQGEIYTFSYKQRNSTNVYLYIAERNSPSWSSGTVIRNIVNDGQLTSYTFTIQNTSYLTIGFQNNATVTDIPFEELQLEKGARKTSYEEYGTLVTTYNTNVKASNNMLDQSRYISLTNMTYSNGIFSQTQADSNNNPNININAYNGNTYVDTLGVKRMLEQANIIYFQFTKTSAFNRIQYKVNGTQIDTGVMLDVSFLKNNKQYYIGATFTNKTQGSISWKEMYINEDNAPYDEYKDSTTNNLIRQLVYNQKNQLERYVNYENKTVILSNSETDISTWVEYSIENLPPNTPLTFSCSYTIDRERSEDNTATVNMSIRDNNNNLLASVSDLPDYGGDITLHFTSSTSTIKIRFGGNISQGQYLLNSRSDIIFNDLMLVKGENALPYERACSSPFKLTEENNCKILSFNINEKTDLYYTSLPYNEMTVEVDNENGYFTDYSPNCILSKLNNDCYIDLFMKINEDKYYKIMTMNFYEVSSTNYEKAKLNFRSSLSKLNTLSLKDKGYKFFSLDGDYMSNYDVSQYFIDNYNILLMNSWSAIGYMDVTNPNRLYDLLLSSMFWLTFLTTDYSNNVKYKLVSNYELPERTVETISNNLQLDRPAIKKGRDYDILIKKVDWDIQSEQREYYYEISGKLTSKIDTIVIPPRGWNLRELTSADITYEGNITVTKHIPDYNIPAVLVLEISGEIGETYRIIINKQAVTYDNIKGEIEDKIYKYKSEYDESKKIVLDSKHQVGLMYYMCLFDVTPIVSYVEVKCIGLPYLEIGDIVEVENYLTSTIKIAITGIDYNYDGGCTMTIKGYSLDWSVLFPSDDLYPSDTLYPNTQQSTRGGVRRG